MEDILPYIFSNFWVWIPIAAIIAGSFSEWLKFKEKTAELGDANKELKGALDEVRSENSDLIRRIQNLEAIVTHEVWDAAKSDADRPSAAARIDAALLDIEPSDTDRAAALARRLRT